MSEIHYRYLFGPVASRRIGSSLGVDLVPPKTCTYNCVYCEVGRTNVLSLERRDWSPASDIMAELESRLSDNLKIDYITFTGSGEPTLHSRLGELISWTKDKWPHKIAVLTNGSLLWREDVRRDLERADLVVPTVSAGSDATWQKLHRPVKGLDFLTVSKGIADYFHLRKGVWAEILLVAGVNDSAFEMQAIAEFVKGLNAEKVQVHTVARPPAEDWAKPVRMETLQRMADMIGPVCDVVPPAAPPCEGKKKAGAEEVLALLSRRPCTVSDIAAGLDISLIDAEIAVDGLLRRGAIIRRMQGQQMFFMGANIPKT
ncbi:MAG: radical SAM protein [Candidatus Brocadiia bacterium]